MPIPTPDKNEKEDKFISRCISELSHKDPNRSHNQIVAMCYSEFGRHTKKKSIKENLTNLKDFKLEEKEVFYIEKGLTREEALKKTSGRVKGDHRGFTYEPETGKCVYI